MSRHDIQNAAAGVDQADRLVGSFGTVQPTCLAVWSHPDDESFVAGGLLAAITRRGGRVVTATATLGEHGTHDPELDPPAELAVRRRAELAAALTELGGDPAHHLGFADGGCDRIPDALGARIVGAMIDRVRPDVVLSFGPDGVTGHPDHQAVARWTRRAVSDRGDVTPILTAAASRVWPADCVERLRTIGAFWPGYPCISANPAEVVVGLDGELLERKLAALACHASQIGPVTDALGSDGLRRLAAAEAYRPANPAARRRLDEELVPIAA